MSAPIARLNLLAERWPKARWRVLTHSRWHAVVFMWVPRADRGGRNEH